MKPLSFSALLLSVLILTISNVFGQHSLVSGKPIKLNPDSTYGRFALPSVNGFMMGTAHVNDDAYPDLFLYSDKYNPGTFLYQFEKFGKDGTPVYSDKRKITIPFEKETQNKAVILENDRKDILGYWAFGNELKYGLFDKKNLTFSAPKTINVKNLPGGITHFGVIQLAASRYLFLFTVSDTVRSAKYPATPTDPARRHQYESYGQEGFWQQQLPKSGIYGAFTDRPDVSTLDTKALTSLTQTYYSLEGYTLYTLQGEQYLIAGTTLGNIHAYQIDAQKETLSERGYITDPEGQTLRNPAIHGYLTYFKSPAQQGLIVSSEGGIYFYKSDEKKNKNGSLVLRKPVHLLQSNPDLYGSSLVVPELVDWDGDGDLDIVSGTSLGYIYFIENAGTNLNPKYKTPVNIKAGGYDIYIQPGYNQDIQGPVETRWGYSSPTVYDWNGDGLPDILTGDSRGKFNIYLNKGTRTKPALEPEHPLYLDGLDVHGAWRVKPGVGKMAGKNTYVMIDTDDEFHLYRQLDNYNLLDGGKLTIGDSIPIRANFKKGGEIGRSKISIVDWDQDGVKDLLVGTPRYATIPEPKKGMPFRLKDNGAAVVFLRNSGTEERPVYEYPVALKFKGERINMGQHECGVATGYLGGNSLNLVVGSETGRFYFYKREDLDWGQKAK
ncbi:hypothetical protein DYBT9275_02318 [Dyadobacter sp. CECT 9275]|uniref:VCBS repeat-containing protein n=1 Tax=Dyadobacter helix TaxID=2822344 RepID=A0A916JDW1_9BACT|nr:VCBS repeat-containing protein [Dyadobacter sp. CECT 9275]CAG4999828.1 hypothetical protein DYBT9275_02318 [Dyadobacter sp. CECT 9275]